MAFPFTRLDLTAQIYYSGSWHAITRDVMVRDNGRITITRGRSGEGSRSTPASMHLQLLNSRSKVNDSIVGRYSPRNVNSDLYGVVGRNTPIRTYTGTEHPGAGGGTSTVSTSHVAPSVTATAAGLLVNAWYGNGVGNYSGIPGTAGPETDGGVSTMRSAYQTVSAGATGTKTATYNAPRSYASASTVIHGASVAVEETLSGVSDTVDDITLTTDASTQAGWWLVAVQAWARGVDELMPDAPYGDHGGWIEVADSGHITDGSSATYVRVRMWARRVSVAGAQEVIFPGVAEARSVTAADNHGHLYVLSGVADWDIRGTCEVPAWPPSWDTSGQDVWVSVEAAGVLRRLGQGASPLLSPLRRALTGAGVTRQTTSDLLPVCYWPIEDPDGATVAASGLPGGTPMTVSGGTIEWASVSSPGSTALPDLRQSTGTLSGPVTGVSSTWGVGCMVQYTDTTSWTCLTIQMGSSTYARLQITVGATVTVTGHTSTGSSTILTGAIDLSDGEPHWIELHCDAVDYALRVDGDEKDSMIPTLPGAPSSLSVHPRSSGDTATIGHVGVTTSAATGTWTYVAGPALDGHAGEVAGRRIERLCREAGIALHAVGDLDDTTPMGAQSTATLLTLLRECEDVDGGILHEPREVLGLAYRCRTARYNLPVTLAVDYSAGEIAPPLEPVDDDRYVRNDVTASRTGGSSAQYEVTTGPLSVNDPTDDPPGVGRYDESVQLNVELDTQLLDQASWRAHLGTVDEQRYPTVHVNLARLAKDGKTTLARTAAALDVGDRLTISNLPAWLPPDYADQQVEGMTEVLGQFARDLYYVCVPNSPYRVGVVEDDELGRADTEGSELASGVDADDTSWSVSTTSGPVWINSTDHASMFPFDIRIGGERVTVTAISGTTSPQTFTVTRSVNGISKSHDAGVSLSLWTKWRAAL